MHRDAAVLFAILLGSTMLPAQTPTVLKSGQAQQTVLQVSPLVNTCPIALHAQQSSAVTRREVGNGDARPAGIAQSLHLTVTNPDSRRIVQANVTVRGFADKARIVQTMSGSDSFDAARTMDVRFPVGSGKEASADLRVPGLTAVSVIDLNSVMYSDGSTWKLGAGGSCRSWIDGLMLVSSQ